jgi:hypothetical protein
VCHLCFGSYTLCWEYDPPSILFCDGVRLQIAMGDQAPVGLAIQQLWKLRAILANSPNSIPPERVFSNSQPEEGGELRARARVVADALAA